MWCGKPGTLLNIRCSIRSFRGQIRGVSPVTDDEGGWRATERYIPEGKTQTGKNGRPAGLVCIDATNKPDLGGGGAP